MRNFRILFTFMAVLLLGTSISAQNKKIIEKAEAKVSQLNEKLTNIDASLALTEEQTKAAHETFLAGMVEIKEARKSASSKEAGKEAQKPINKAMNKKIRMEVLNKEQRKALSKANKDKKAKKE